MGSILRSPINGNGIVLTERSGSHSLGWAAINEWWPCTIIPNDNRHPATIFSIQEHYDGTQTNLGIVVRNPIERFRSMVAREIHKKSLEEQLENPTYRPLPKGDFVKYFKFETELQICADWLGLINPLPIEDASVKENKPILTSIQQSRVYEIYAEDIALWNSLNQHI